MLGQKYLRLRNAPHLWRGPKPGNAVPRQPSQAWRGWGEQGVHVINIKSLSATNRRRILYIFDPYTQEHNIHRTPRRSGGFARGVWEVLFPCQPPPCLPPAPEGGCTDSTSVTKSPVKLARIIRTARGWSGPPLPCPPRCPGGEGGEEDGENERGQVPGALSQTHKVLGVSGPSERS